MKGMKTMTSRERFVTAMRGGIPDRVPVTPDMSNAIPCKRTGLPCWEVYWDGAVPLWKAYLDAADYYGIDAWSAASGWAPFVWDRPAVTVECRRRYASDRDAMVLNKTLHTPDGAMRTEEVCFRFNPPSMVVKPVADPVVDRAKSRWLFQAPERLDMAQVEAFRTECHRRGHAFGYPLGYPGFHAWEGMVQGGVMTLAYLMLDDPAILDEWYERQLEQGTQMLELMLAVKPDYILFGGSGTITLASPELARRYAIPALKKWSATARAAGVPTMLHSCGKSRGLVDMLVAETQVDCINPLEIAPMGDVDLAEVKRARGQQIALMGNLHTTEVMLRGSPARVREQALAALRDAGRDGGFILSTGDQCGRDTPEENIFTLVETARTAGIYGADGCLVGGAV